MNTSKAPPDRNRPAQPHNRTSRLPSLVVLLASLRSADSLADGSCRFAALTGAPLPGGSPVASPVVGIRERSEWFTDGEANAEPSAFSLQVF